MKPILVDEFVKDSNDCQSEVNVTINGKIFTGYQIAKPLNYDPDYFSMEDRQEMANAVLEGKAIAVRYFCDLTEQEQIDYVKSKFNPDQPFKNGIKHLKESW
jgi:hypothetical protein